jgi:hypothetical protein
MTQYIYPVTVSALFALIYGEAVIVRLPNVLPFVLAVTFLLWLLSYIAPQELFRYDNSQAAPVVLSQLMKRAALSVMLVLAAGIFVLAITGLWLDLPLIEELYAATLAGVIIFHGFGGPFAHHIVYLQQTHQYNSNQLAAVLIAFTLILFVLVLFFLNLDFAIVRDAHVQRRDLLMLSTLLVGYGWTVVKVAHH